VIARAPLMVAAASVLALAACSPGYVVRAGYEEAKILWRREPIRQLLARTDLDAATRAKLEVVLAVRAFARETLQLRVGGSYASYARVDANQVVHVVSAAPRLQLQPYTWWFPIVGRVPYKGFFSLAAAQAEAACLERAGYDTYVRPSVAFSTLGWFDDPLLSTLLRYDRVTLADVVIHELLHNTVYVGGHADFDESFANFVGHRGAIEFFTRRSDGPAAAQAMTQWNAALRFSEFLGRVAQRLRAAYAGGATMADRDRLFHEAQAEFRALAGANQAYAEFGNRPLNNAIILHYLLYADRLHLFEDIFRRHGDDLAAAIQTVLNIVRGARPDPFAALETYLSAPQAPAAATLSATRSPPPKTTAAGWTPLSDCAFLWRQSWGCRWRTCRPSRLGKRML
jgi:predicted aminopeptidase